MVHDKHAAPHRHGHAHEHHHHSHAQGVDERRLAIAASLTFVFMIVEVVGGLIAGSLALVADAMHMLTDSASLILAWLALRLARRPASWSRTYGFDRLSILIAYTNGLALFAIAAWIVVEAWHRLSEPVAVLGGLMFWVALAGLAVNLLAFYILQGGSRENLNMRAAMMHVVGDLLGSAGALIAALVIIWTGWRPIDPILSVVVSLIVLRAAWSVVRESSHILLEGAPHHLDARTLQEDLVAAVPEVSGIHHVHVWSITQERPMVTLHAILHAGSDPTKSVVAIKKRLRSHFQIAHATIETEFERCADAAQ